MNPISLFGSGWLLAYMGALVVGRLFTATTTFTSEIHGATGWIVAFALGFGIVTTLYLLPKTLTRLLPQSRPGCLLAGMVSFLVAVAISLAGPKASIFTLIALVALSPIAGVALVGGARHLLRGKPKRVKGSQNEGSQNGSDFNS